jgi:DASH complex subunit SPC19
LQHFELVSEHDLTTAQASLLSEIQPEVNTLLGRVETYLDKLERREQSLIAKAELQEGRLSQPSRAKSPARMHSASAATGNGDLSAAEEMKLQQLRQKKERLSYAVSRLELQANQRQRQLRKSMAAQ